MSIAACAISYNEATTRGGGLGTTAGRVDVVDSLIVGNLVNSPGTALGGGVFSEDSILSMARCLIALNQANGQTAYGGGIYALDSTVSLDDCMVVGNTANGGKVSDGGGIYNSGGALDFPWTIVLGNRAKKGVANVFRKP